MKKLKIYKNISEIESNYESKILDLITDKEKELIKSLIANYLVKNGNKKQIQNYKKFFGEELKEKAVESVEVSNPFDLTIKTINLLKTILDKKRLTGKEKSDIIKGVLDKLNLETGLIDIVLKTAFKNKIDEYDEKISNLYTLAVTNKKITYAIVLHFLEYEKTLEEYERVVFANKYLPSFADLVVKEFKREFRDYIIDNKDLTGLLIYMLSYHNLEDISGNTEWAFKLENEILKDDVVILHIFKYELEDFVNKIMPKLEKERLKEIVKFAFNTPDAFKSVFGFSQKELKLLSKEKNGVSIINILSEMDIETLREFVKNNGELFLSIVKNNKNKFNKLLEDAETLQIILKNEDLHQYLEMFASYLKNKTDCKKALENDIGVIAFLSKECPLYKDKEFLMNFLKEHKEELQEKSIDWDSFFERVDKEILKDIEFLDTFLDVDDNLTFYCREVKEECFDLLTKLFEQRGCKRVAIIRIGNFDEIIEASNKEQIKRILSTLDRCYKRLKCKEDEYYNCMQYKNMLDDLTIAIYEELSKELKEKYYKYILDKKSISRKLEEFLPRIIPESLLYDEEFLLKLLKEQSVELFGNIKKYLKEIVDKNNIEKFLNIYIEKYREKHPNGEISFKYLKDNTLKSRFKRIYNKLKK